MSNQKRSRGPAAAKTSGAPTLLSSTAKTTPRYSQLTADGELRKLGNASEKLPTGINFGSPSSRSNTSSSSSSGLWSDLLKKSAPSGLSRVVSGGLLGLVSGSFLSHIGDLFSKKATPPPLERFSLPSSSAQVVEVSRSSGTIASQNYSQPTTLTRAYADRNAEIVKAVRDSLLTSGQLSDVISEI